MWSVLCALVIVPGLGAKELAADDYWQFPRLYHLDDYEACLASRGGLYCLGSFGLAPLDQGHRVFDLMVEYSKQPLHFNRTVLHRGYCVSSRCPNAANAGIGAGAGASALNQSERFAACVARWARTRHLQATPLSVDYCKSTEQASQEIELDTPKIVFLGTVFCILFCNVVGTTYDMMTADDVKKNPYLMAWSWRSSWQRLTAPHAGSAGALQPAQGLRVFILLLVMWMHCGLIHYKLYSYNPRYLEKMMRDPIVMMVRNGTALVQVFVMLSSFLLAHNLLQYSKSQPLRLRALPQCVLNRLVRIWPMYLFVLGFAATWWPALRSGPQWASVEAEAAICRRKFWTQMLFLNNLLQTDDHCFIQTWFLAVDMQLFVVSCALTLLLAGRRAAAAAWPPGRGLRVLAALFLAACLVNGALAYWFQWKGMLYIMNPENLHSLYRGVASFSRLYMSPWGSLPASLLGLLLAHLHFYLQETGFKFHEHKWLVRLYHCSIPLLVALVLSGLALEHHSSRAATTLHAALERPLFCLLAAVCMLGMFHGVDNCARRAFSWRGWQAPARASLAALLLHWAVALTVAAARPALLPASYWDIVWDWAATAAATYALAVPLTALVELPAQRLAAALLT